MKTIYVTVKLRASQEKVSRVDDIHFQIWVHKPPVDGQANEAVIRMVADFFDCSPSCVSIVSGHKRRDKVVLIKN
jgi:uncharacterized protein